MVITAISEERKGESGAITGESAAVLVNGELGRDDDNIKDSNWTNSINAKIFSSENSVYSFFSNIIQFFVCVSF